MSYATTSATLEARISKTVILVEEQIVHLKEKAISKLSTNSSGVASYLLEVSRTLLELETKLGLWKGVQSWMAMKDATVEAALDMAATEVTKLLVSLFDDSNRDGEARAAVRKAQNYFLQDVRLMLQAIKAAK